MDYGCFEPLVTLGGNRSPLHSLVDPVLMGLYVDGDVVFAVNEIVPDMGDRVVAIRASIEAGSEIAPANVERLMTGYVPMRPASIWRFA